MTTVDRRAMLRLVLGGAAAATAGLALIPGSAESAPLIVSKGLAPELESSVEDVVVRVRRRRVCRWRRGRRVCTRR